MFGSLNRVQIIGSLGADPEFRSFQNGGRVCNFRVACSESWKDKSTGERKEKTEWVSVAVFNEGLIGLIERYLRKGSKVFVEGKFQTRKWQDQGGNDRYTTEVVVQGFGGNVLKLDKKDSDSGGRRDDSGSDNWGGGSSSSGRGGDFNGGAGRSGGFSSGFDNDLDDEVPF